MQGLESASGFIRSELAHRVNLRNTPQLRFIMDDSIAYGVSMSKKISEVMEADEKAEKDREARGIDIDDNSAYVHADQEEE